MKMIRVAAGLLALLLLFAGCVGCAKQDTASDTASASVALTEDPEALDVARRYAEAALALDVKTVAALTPDCVARVMLAMYEREATPTVREAYEAMLRDQLDAYDAARDDQTPAEVLSCDYDRSYDLARYAEELSQYGITEDEIAAIQQYSAVTIHIKYGDQDVAESTVCGKIDGTWYVLI